MRPLVDSIANLLENAADHSTETYMSVEDFLEAAESIEDYITANLTEVYDDSLKAGNAAARLLAALSIARNSYSYWVDAANNSSAPWYDRIDSISYTAGQLTNGGAQTRSLWSRIWKAIKTAACDVWGFMSCPTCGNNYPGGPGYDLGEAWDYAGEKSSGN